MLDACIRIAARYDCVHDQNGLTRRPYQEGHDQNHKHAVERCQEAPDQHLLQGDKQFVGVRRGEDQPVVMVTQFMTSVLTGILQVSVGKLDEEFEKVTSAIDILIRGF